MSAVQYMKMQEPENESPDLGKDIHPLLLRLRVLESFWEEYREASCRDLKKNPRDITFGDLLSANDTARRLKDGLVAGVDRGVHDRPIYRGATRTAECDVISAQENAAARRIEDAIQVTYRVTDRGVAMSLTVSLVTFLDAGPKKRSTVQVARMQPRRHHSEFDRYCR